MDMAHFQTNGIWGFRAECVRRAQTPGHRTTQLIIDHAMNMMIHGVGIAD